MTKASLEDADHILYQSEDDRVFLVDVPASIANAQGEHVSCIRALLSNDALRLPYRSTEPKNSSASVSNFTKHESLHDLYTLIARDALDEIQLNLAASEQWCHPRKLICRASKGGESKKRKRDDENENAYDHCSSKTSRIINEDEIKQCLFSLQVNDGSQLSACVRVSTTHDPNSADDTAAVKWEGFLKSDSDQYRRLTAPFSSSSSLSSSLQREFCFTIPPKSGFLTGDIRSTADMFDSVVEGKFDFILLDPPWPNKSADRKRNYSLASDEHDLKDLLSCIEVDTRLKPNGDGFVGIWITNAAKYRNLVLDAGALFDKWNVRLIEEWLWIKVTLAGEPVTPLDGIWRKPYEVLLIGQSSSSCTSTTAASYASGGSASIVKRRAIVAVPDLHSRKPCIKAILERTLLKARSGYAALEVFARYLVQGWFSWGDEVLKFNCDDYWEPK